MQTSHAKPNQETHTRPRSKMVTLCINTESPGTKNKFKILLNSLFLLPHAFWYCSHFAHCLVLKIRVWNRGLLTSGKIKFKKPKHHEISVSYFSDTSRSGMMKITQYLVETRVRQVLFKKKTIQFFF